MAKKSRRAKRRAKKTRSKPAVRPKRPASAPSPTVAKETRALTEEKAAELAEEYRYVFSDLKRIAVLAGAMFAALIILSFVIR
ncbi:MAG: hypothetical protein V3T92_02660 [Anaerolineae bacterium]